VRVCGAVQYGHARCVGVQRTWMTAIGHGSIQAHSRQADDAKLVVPALQPVHPGHTPCPAGGSSCCRCCLFHRVLLAVQLRHQVVVGASGEWRTPRCNTARTFRPLRTPACHCVTRIMCEHVQPWTAEDLRQR
jgi:hypothetical protein